MTEQVQHIHLDTTDSTNNFLRTLTPQQQEKPITLVTTDFQTAGRGQRGNSWESQAGKNLIYSILVHPTAIRPSQMFAISEATALSVCEALDECCQEGLFSIKWPNDIYYGDRKIAGILIETDIMGGHIANAIIGVGVNINQHQFLSDAPNPISLYQILGHEQDRHAMLDAIMQRFTSLYALMQQGHLTTLHTRYMQRLYRRQGFHSYTDERGTFQARILDVEPTGHYILEDTEGHQRRYAFKEVCFR